MMSCKPAIVFWFGHCLLSFESFAFPHLVITTPRNSHKLSILWNLQSLCLFTAHHASCDYFVIYLHTLILLGKPQAYHPLFVWWTVL